MGIRAACIYGKKIDEKRTGKGKKKIVESFQLYIGLLPFPHKMRHGAFLIFFLNKTSFLVVLANGDWLELV